MGETYQRRTPEEVEAIEALRARLTEEQGGWIGFNDPGLEGLIPHIWDEPTGASGVHHGLLLGGEIYPDAEAARRRFEPEMKPEVEVRRRLSQN